MPDRVYPLPDEGDDPRFTFGLVFDIAGLLEGHGYPPIKGRDLLELRQALFRFLYAPSTPPEEGTHA